MNTQRVVAFAIAALLAGPALAQAQAAKDPGAPSAPSRTAAAPDLSTPPLADTAPSAAGTGHIFASALYGGLAGALIGAGVGLIENGNYGRDIAIGAGAGILIGAALGAAGAFGDQRAFPATDGLNTTERYPVLQGKRVSWGGRF